MKWERFVPSHNTRRERWWDAGRAKLLRASRALKNSLRSSSNTSHILWHFPEEATDSPCAHVSTSRLAIICLGSLRGTVPLHPVLWQGTAQDTGTLNLNDHSTLSTFGIIEWIHMWLLSLQFFILFFFVTMWQTPTNRTLRHHLHTVIASGTKGKKQLKETMRWTQECGGWGVWLH